MDERRQWSERHRTAEGMSAPSPFVVRAIELLAAERALHDEPVNRRALDVACGRGRHALLLAAHGYDVDAVDYALPALASLQHTAGARDLRIQCLAVDLTTWPLPVARYALVTVVDFLERSLFTALREAVTPGGTLLVETFLNDGTTSDMNPAFLITAGELDAVGEGWEILARHRDAKLHRGRRRAHAGVLARRPGEHLVTH